MGIPAGGPESPDSKNMVDLERLGGESLEKATVGRSLERQQKGVKSRTLAAGYRVSGQEPV